MTKADIKKEVRLALSGVYLHKWRNTKGEIDYIITYCLHIWANAYKAGKEAAKNESKQKINIE